METIFMVFFEQVFNRTLTRCTCLFFHPYFI